AGERAYRLRRQLPRPEGDRLRRFHGPGVRHPRRATGSPARSGGVPAAHLRRGIGMRISDIRLRHCAAQLAGPMRSRGDVGYTEYFHTGSEFQRLAVVELLTDDGRRGFTLLPGAIAGLPDFLEQVALPALRGQDPACVPFLRRALLSAAR